jgi:ABC-type uncharacterized transport system involved in gliding motility auxiliary subunit
MSSFAAAERHNMRHRKFETFLYSAVGVAGMFVLTLAIYVVTSAVKLRVDITADKAHTLSAGTKNILAKLDSQVTLRFYCTQDDNAMPPALRTYARHIEELLREYQQEAKGKLIIQKFDPKPDSDIEDAARLNGIEGRGTGPFDSDKIYLGLVVSLLDEKFALPWLAPERERLLEYDISRAIARVVNSRPVIGIMTGLPVFGEPPNPLLRPGESQAEDWTFITELKKDFAIKEVPLTASKIDEQIKVLLVAHPVNVSDTAQYAIDQFVQRGGKLLAFLDPHAYFDQKHDRNPDYSMVGDNAANSSLDKLLKAWGLGMDVNLVAADTSFASRNLQTGDSMPTLLLVTRQGIDQNDVATSQIDNLVFPFAGAFIGQPADGVKETVLVKSSPNSELVDSLIATAASERILRNFKPANVAYPLAVHLTGKFKTAFPNGPPSFSSSLSSFSNSGLADTPTPLHSDSTSTSEIILVADTDMLNDKVCVRVQNVMGRPVIHAVNGNLHFVQSLVESLAGDEDLISARNRAGMSHPFTRVKEMEAKAGKQWQEKLLMLETKQRETEQRIKQLQTRGSPGQEQSLILSPEQERELEAYQRTLVEVGKDLKQVRKNLRKDTDALVFRTKVVNIATMPLVVAISGVGLSLLKFKRRSCRK